MSVCVIYAPDDIRRGLTKIVNAMMDGRDPGIALADLIEVGVALSLLERAYIIVRSTSLSLA